MFGQGSFLIDPNATPEQVARNREMLAQLMSQPTARYAGEGLARLGAGIVAGIGQSRLNRTEDAGRASARETVERIFRGGPATSGGVSGGPLSGFPTANGAPILGTPFIPSGAATPSSMASQPAGKPAAARSPALPPSGDMATRIRQGLTQRGLPPHVADAFLMNFQDESGLDPAINEISPLVPGSRGGFGLSQWTGPRRRQLEAFAQQRGVPVSDVDLQLDFLMSELQGSEARAGERILSAPDTGSAAAAIVNDFLRPAEQHRARREARYTGGAVPPRGGAAQPTVRNASNLPQLYEALANPWLSESERQAVTAMITAQERDMDPMRQLQMEQLGLQIEQMRNPQPSARLITGAEAEAMGLPPGAYNQLPDGRIVAIGGGGTTINNNISPDTAPGLGNLATDYGYVLDPTTGRPVIDPATGLPQAAPVPGSATARDIEAASAAADRRDTGETLRLGTSLESINLNLAEIENGGLPVTGAFGDFRRTNLGRALTGSGAVDFDNRTRQVTDAAAFAEIQRMRDNSPTGGAVGQLTDAERVAIGNAVTALNSSTSASEYSRAARAYRDLALNLAFGEGMWEMDQEGQVRQRSAPGPQGGSRVEQSAPEARTTRSVPPDWMLNTDISTWTPQQIDEAERFWGIAQ